MKLRRRLLGLATLAGIAVVVLPGPAAAATADDHASCAGLVGPYYSALGPGVHAEVTLRVVAEMQSEGMPPGANFHDFASFHDGTAEACLG